MNHQGHFSTNLSRAGAILVLYPVFHHERCVWARDLVDIAPAPPHQF